MQVNFPKLPISNCVIKTSGFSYSKRRPSPCNSIVFPFIIASSNLSSRSGIANVKLKLKTVTTTKKMIYFHKFTHFLSADVRAAVGVGRRWNVKYEKLNSNAEKCESAKKDIFQLC
jgi:hypothetical protein